MPVMRIAHNRHNTLFLSREGFGTYEKELLRNPVRGQGGKLGNKLGDLFANMP